MEESVSILVLGYDNKPDLAQITHLSPLTCVLAVDPCDEVDPLDGEFGCR